MPPKSIHREGLEESRAGTRQSVYRVRTPVRRPNHSVTLPPDKIPLFFFSVTCIGSQSFISDSKLSLNLEFPDYFLGVSFHVSTLFSLKESWARQTRPNPFSSATPQLWNALAGSSKKTYIAE